MVAPTEVESMMVTMFMSAFCTVSDRRSVTPHSRKRLPSIRQPTSGAVDGRSRMTKMVTMIGKRIFSLLETDARLHHLDLAVFLAREELHDGRLDQRDQRHIGVGRNGDGTEKLGRELRSSGRWPSGRPRRR